MSYDDHLKRLKELYDDKAGDFDKYFALLVGLSLFVLFFLLFPYVLTQQAEYDISKKLDRVSQNLTAYQNEVKVFETIQEVILNLQHGRDSFPTELESFIYGLTSSQNTFIAPNATLPTSNVSVQQTPFYYTRFAFCTGDSEILNNKSKFLECNVNQKIVIEMNGLNRTLFTEVILPLSAVDKESQIAIGVEELKKEVPKVSGKLYDIVYRYRSIWNDSSSNAISSSLSSLMNEFLGKYHKRIGEQVLKLNPLLQNLNQTANEIKTNLADLNAKKKDITKRITEFESPIGKLAAGFDDVVLVFPIAVVGGFLVCSTFLTQTFRYRREYLKSYPIKDSNSNTLQDPQKAVTAPLWIDKQSSLLRNVGRFLVLLVPLAIFIASFYLINYSWSLPGSTLGYNEDYRNIIRWLYWAVGTSLFVYSYVKIIYEAAQ